MHRATAARWLSRTLRTGEAAHSTGLSVPSCLPGGHHSAGASHKPWAVSSPPRRRAQHTGAAPVNHDDTTTSTEPSEANIRPLRLMCSGCGAFTQTRDPQQLGYYDLKSTRVEIWMHPKTCKSGPKSAEDQIVQKALQSMDSSRLEELGLTSSLMLSAHDEELAAKRALKLSPVCERCHSLTHHSSTGNGPKTIHHPTVESLRETIEESPHKYNHIYHIIDAADFPMSLIPRLHVLLGDVPLRSRNRRARAEKYRGNRHIAMSFIITRSDLLAPGKEMVDAMLPQLRESLRDALGKFGERIRLGNVNCVSAKRGWWTKTVLDDIYQRGGAAWLVGKVNVGKSALFSAIFPKGRMTEEKNIDGASAATHSTPTVSADSVAGAEVVVEKVDKKGLEVGEFLPPPRPEINYPEMPLVSLVPGTTASPIRIPFGGDKGELIDLPGLARSDLPMFVKEEYRKSLIMLKRIVPRQHSVTQGESLLLGGGLIRIEPRTPNLTFLMYNFTPLDDHLTSTEKAIEFVNSLAPSRAVKNIMVPGTGDKIRLAQTIAVKHDVTKKRAGPLTRKDAVGLGVDKLPFRVLSVDILIEGVGYVEVTVQVRSHEHKAWALEQEQADELERDERKRQSPKAKESLDGEGGSSMPDDPFGQMVSLRKDSMVVRQPDWPAVDVYTPEGRFVAWRTPLGGWLHNQPPGKKKKKRPRRSMKGQKKQKKAKWAQARVKLSAEGEQVYRLMTGHVEE